MSCQINVTANILDTAAIRRCLFPTDDARGSDSWLQLCELSISPTGDIIAIAKERRLVILSMKWDSSSSVAQYQISFSASVHESDNIKSVLCLPIIGQSKSSHVVPDWTCVLLGFESGYIRCYTENCDLLLEEQLHCEVISSVKCRSQHNPRPDIATDLHPEEIYIQYQSTLCVVPGSQLFPILRVCRSNLARVQAKGLTQEPSHGNLNPKKWGFEDQATIRDTAVVGVNLHSTFDHLLMVSTSGGFETKYRSSAPYNNLVLAAGSRPFLGYHYALEGATQPVLSDVAKAVATKLKSALPGWLTGTRPSLEKPMSAAMQPSDVIGCRFGLCDLRRTTSSVVLSPNHKLAAVSDALGRVLLVDAFRGITLRIFKGYREAQCAFIQVPDERHSKHRIGNKVALFLAIYSPKKGTVEIFTVQQGQKICTFSASRYSRLVYNNYGLMGFATTTKSRFVCPFHVVLVDNDGQVKDILIPFHFALSEKNNTRARDIHLYKKIKQFVKRGDDDLEALHAEIFKICTELKTVELKLQVVEFLVAEKTLPAELILRCCEHFLEDVAEGEADTLKTVARNVKLLLELFSFALEDNGNSVAGQTNLNIDPKQMDNLQKLLDLSTRVEDSRGAKVGFTRRCISAAEFLSIFTLHQDLVEVKPGVDGELLFKTSELIFRKHIEGCDQDALARHLDKTAVPINDLFFLLVHYWVNRPLDAKVNLENEMSNLLGVARVLVEVSPDDSRSKFWGEIRDILANSSKPFPALTAAIVCKIASDSTDTSSLDDDNLEIMSEEGVEWSLLIGKLEDVSLLNIVLSSKPFAMFGTLPKLKHEPVDVSLRHVLAKGRGSVSELVARWLTMCGVNPENVVINDVLLKKSQENESASEEDDDDDALPEQDIMPQKIEEVQSEQVLHQLNKLKTQFPYSLDASKILANMCWEYAMSWQKNIEDLSHLEAAIKCLQHIPDSHIREGLFNLAWNTHMKMLFESTAKLINKVGKLPMERLCRQDTGLADYQVARFLAITTSFLDTYMDAIQQNNGRNKPVLQFEQLWENGSQPLVEFALCQNPINYDLLQLHYQFSLALQMMTVFNVKHPKPMTHLFESYTTSLFFVDFQTKAQINWDYADGRVQTSRTQFLLKVISASLESVTVNGNQVYSGDHMTWMEKCLDLARLWNLDLDELRRHELAQIYTNGYDSYGDEIFRGVEQRSKLGPALLAVAGRRLSQFLTTSPSLCENMVALSPAVTRYMEQLNGDWCAPSSLQAIENVANRSLACLEEGQYEYKIAEMMLDGVRTLRSIHEID